MNENHNIVIPEQLFVGLKREPSISDVPVAMIVPNGTDSVSKKRISRIQSWAAYRPYNSEKTANFNTLVLDNTPISGFRISKSLRRLGWTNKEMLVRVEDPRGFELDISVSNLIMIIDNNLLHNGEIAQACVWGRDGSENKLLPTNSIPYVQAVANTERTGKKVSVRSVKQGDEILLHDGRKGIYMGNMYAYTTANVYDQHPIPRVCDKKKHVVRIQTSDDAVLYQGFASIKISEILNANPLTEVQLMEMLSSDCKDAVVTFKNVSSENYHKVNFLHYRNDLKFCDIELSPVSWDEMMRLSAKYKMAFVSNTPNGMIKMAIGQFNTQGKVNTFYSNRYYQTMKNDEVLFHKVNDDYVKKQSFTLGGDVVVKLNSIELNTISAVFNDNQGNMLLKIAI